MITRANRRKHLILYKNQIYRILLEVNGEKHEEAARMANWVEHNVRTNPGAERYINHAENYGEMFHFNRFRPKGSKFNQYFDRPIEVDYNPFEKEWEIKQAWRQDNKAQLEQIEREVWGDLVSKYPKKVAP